MKERMKEIDSVVESWRDVQCDANHTDKENIILVAKMRENMMNEGEEIVRCY